MKFMVNKAEDCKDLDLADDGDRICIEFINKGIIGSIIFLVKDNQILIRDTENCIIAMGPK